MKILKKFYYLEGLKMLCIKTGAEITFECDGEDEEAAMAKVEELASQNFGE